MWGIKQNRITQKRRKMSGRKIETGEEVQEEGGRRGRGNGRGGEGQGKG